MKKIKFIALVLAICVLFGNTVFAASDFCDVTEEHWAYENIQKAASMGIIQGYAPDEKGDVYFKPTGSVTVGAGKVMVQRTMVQLGLLQEAEAIEPGTPVASRVVIADYAAEKMGYSLSPMAALKYTDASSIALGDVFYLDALYRYGIMQGYSDGSFGPETNINRAQFAAICVRMAELERKGIINQEITNLVGVISAVKAETHEFNLTVGEDTYRCCLAEGSVLYLNGEETDFSAVAEYEKSTVCVGCVAGSNSVLINTELQVINADVTETKLYEDFTSVVVGSAVYYADSATAGTITAGNHSFIAEGCHIIEFK